MIILSSEKTLFRCSQLSDRFRELEAFLAVAETGAFNAASQRLGQSPPVVTRLVTALEARYGVQLFTRTTRRVALTEAGARLRLDAARILAELDAAEAAVMGARQTPRGVLRLTAPILFGETHLAPILRAFLDAHPDMTARALFLDRTVDLIEEGLDIAARIGSLPDSSLVATRVGFVRRVVVAAPGYLAQAGPIDTLDTLRHHRIIHATGADPRPEWVFSAAGATDAVRILPTLAVNTLAAAIEAARSGWGVTRALSYQVADALADGGLVEVLAPFEDRRLPVHLLHAEGGRASAKIRAFIDFAAPRLRRSPALQE